MEPVYDLNNDICALVKVVCSHDFAFSSPLGIAKRRNETGEVWLYLPEGSMLLTIKHPQWGVLRDYRFPYPLKSQTTYELHISEPWQQDHIPIGDWSTTTPTNPRRDTLVIISQQTKIRHPRQPLHICLSAGVSIGSASLIPGIRIAAMKRHGLYLSAYSSLRSLPATQGTTAEAITYNTGRTRNSCSLLTAGLIHQLGKGFLLYEGVVGEITRRLGNKLMDSGIAMKKSVIRVGVQKQGSATATVISGLPPLDCRPSPPRNIRPPSVSDSIFQT